jgi:hypothetical protein
MYSQVSWNPTYTVVAEPPSENALQPLDRERFEHLTDAEAVSLLASRSHWFVERGWSGPDALLLAVRPDRAP